MAISDIPRPIVVGPAHSPARCHACGNACIPVIDFGAMPLANGFLRPEDVSREQFFPLCVVACSKCTLVQLTNPVPRETLFPANYAFRSSSSTRMAAHFRQFAGEIHRMVSSEPDALVAEIGSNDGILLRHLAREKVRHVGIEPAGDVAEVSRSLGVNTESAFFGLAVAQDLLERHGSASVIVSANVVCHVADLHDLAAGVAAFLHPDGRFVFEDPYLGDILHLTSFDQMYDEHVFYFSLNSVRRVFRGHGLEVIDVSPQDVHGGSMRYVLAHAGRKSVSASVAELAEQENLLGLGAGSTFEAYRARVAAKRLALRGAINELRGRGKRIVGYAATSKSTTMINYCGLSANDIEYICDTTPGKIGCVSPGAHIPIVSHAAFAAQHPDVAILFAWNHADEIVAKEQQFLAGKGAFLTYVPSVGMYPPLD